jgi:hypothetical protein
MSGHRVAGAFSGWRKLLPVSLPKFTRKRDNTEPLDYGATGTWHLAQYDDIGPGAAP